MNTGFLWLEPDSTVNWNSERFLTWFCLLVYFFRLEWGEWEELMMLLTYPLTLHHNFNPVFGLVHQISTTQTLWLRFTCDWSASSMLDTWKYRRQRLLRDAHSNGFLCFYFNFSVAFFILSHFPFFRLDPLLNSGTENEPTGCVIFIFFLRFRCVGAFRVLFA